MQETKSSTVELDHVLNFNINSLLPYMPDISSFFQSIESLQGNWSVLKVLAASNGMNININEVQDNFIQLSDTLKEELVLAKVHSLLEDQSAKAQSLVDILIRNLFERTADIGFFSMDDDLRKFLSSKFKTGSSRRKAIQAIKTRFLEYQKKYSVYQNIQLFGRVVNGNDEDEIKMILQLDDTNVKPDKTFPNDPAWLKMVSNSNEDYIETFGPCDLELNCENSLIYAHRIKESDDENSETIGVLVLCFSFEDEMKRIFDKLLGTRTLSIACLVDKDGRIISSSNEGLISSGVLLQDSEISSNGLSLANINGEQYLVVVRETGGYEGYFGQGWKGALFISTRFAFKSEPRDFSDKVINSIIGNETLFSANLRSIPEHSQKILSALKLLVLNGQLQHSDHKDIIAGVLEKMNLDISSKNSIETLVQTISNLNDNSKGVRSVLDAVEKVGRNTEDIFYNAIGKLQSVILTTILQAISFMADSATDIMDRNLYERANDVRWWALSKIRSIITENSSLSDEHRKEIATILANINALYTVYTSLIVYDMNGSIIAVSRYDKESDEGVAVAFDDEVYNQILTKDWAKAALENTDSQKYTVSQMEQSPLYENKHTYIYATSITDVNHSDRVVAGIAVVFDSEPQFEAMLQDVLPKDGDGSIKDGYKAIFVSRDGKIISSSDAAFKVGDIFRLNQQDRDKFFELNNGSDYADIVELDGNYYAAAVSVSSGYREYKVTDGYTNDVLAFVLMHLGSITEEKKEIDVFENDYVKHLNPQAANAYQDIFIVASAQQVYAIPTESIKEIINMKGFTKMSGVGDVYYVGQIPYDGSTIPVIDLYYLQTDFKSKDIQEKNSHIVVCHYNGGYMGLMVSDLSRIYRVDETHISSTKVINPNAHYSAMLAPPKGMDVRGSMIPILDVESVLTYLKNKKFNSDS